MHCASNSFQHHLYRKLSYKTAIFRAKGLGSVCMRAMYNFYRKFKPR